MPLIRYISGDPTRGYGRWLLQMMNKNGFDVPKAKLVHLLSASAGFVQTIQQQVDYIHVTEGAMRHSIADGDVPSESLDRIVPNVSIYYNREQLHDWLLKKPTYTCQTKRAPLIEAYGGDIDAVEQHKAIVRQIDAVRKKEVEAEALKDAEFLHEVVEQCEKDLKKHINTYCPAHKFALQHILKRGIIPSAAVAPFEWWNQESGSAFSAAAAVRSGAYTNTEALYREMYLSAAVKITFGTRKTFFYVPPAVPDTLLIPADENLVQHIAT